MNLTNSLLSPSRLLAFLSDFSVGRRRRGEWKRHFSEDPVTLLNGEIASGHSMRRDVRRTFSYRLETEEEWQDRMCEQVC